MNKKGSKTIHDCSMREMSKRLKGHIRAVGRQRRGVAAMEFAILATPFFVLVLGAMEIGYDFFVQIVLSNAVNVAARTVQVGTSQAEASGTAESQWVASAICPALGSLLACGQLYVSVTAIPSGTGQNYYTYISANPPSLTTMTSSSNSACTGAAGQMMLLQAYYLSPTIIGMLVPGWSQVSPVSPYPRVHVTYASVGFVNEFFTGGASSC